VKIIIETIPHASQPYPTVGDWRRDEDGTLHINVSEEIGGKYASLVALHELIEVLLCEDRGITCEEVDAFDKSFEAARDTGTEPEDAEPGDSPFAPYRKEHFFATSLERLMAAELGVDWNVYDDAVMALP